MDALTQVVKLAAGNISRDMHNRVAQDSTQRDINRALGMKKNQNFFYHYNLLMEMAGILNKRLGREPCVDRALLYWKDVVGDQRKKQTDGETHKIRVIDLVSDTNTARRMEPAQKRVLALKIQKWIKNFRFKNTRVELFSWQQRLLSDIAVIHGVQIF